MKSKLLANVTPGEVLDEEFLKPMDITQYRLAKDIGVPPRRINEIVKGQRAITADTALRLGRYFGTTPEFWLNLQTHFDLERMEERLADRLDKEVKVRAALQPAAASTMNMPARNDNRIQSGEIIREPSVKMLPFSRKLSPLTRRLA